MHVMNDLVEDLNTEQREVVTAPFANQLVLAGAGSGKTRVLVHRIAWLMQNENISPHEILAVTFTNKAAAEMRHRLESLLGMSLRSMWVGTFHGLAHRLLRAHWQEAQLPEQFQIMDSDDQHRLVKRIMKEMDIDESRWPTRQAQWFINGKKDAGLRPENIVDDGSLFERQLTKVYIAYEDACQRGGLVDFAELLLRVHELFQEKPEILEHYKKRFSQVLVDEFQDTNTIQYMWIKSFIGDQTKVMVVGDDDQSIYGWRGARVENIRRFESDFTNVHTHRLEQNYRSSGTILAAANHIISRNDERMGKELWTNKGEGEPISVYAAFNELDEARFIVEGIKSWINDGNRRSDIAILYRSNAQSRVLEEAMLTAGIPYRVYGGQRFFERAEIKDALGYLRLVANQGDDAAFERIVNTPTRGIGDRTLNILRERAREEHVCLWKVANDFVEQKQLSPRAHSALLAFIQLINSMIEDTRKLELYDQVEHVIEVSGLIEHFKKDKSEKGRARIENLEELVTAARQFEHEEENELSPLSAFLSHAALEAGDMQGDEYQDCVQLMTLHSAKGLEFSLVFIAGIEEGLFPHQMSVNEPGGLEEERRLCYVGITRAMQKLYLTYAESRRLHGRDEYHKASRFIGEIPEKYLQEVRLKAKVTRPVKRRGTMFTPSKFQEESDCGLRAGQRVMHKKFGDGVILSCDGNGSQARVQVQFTAHGCKWLLVSHAHLEVI